MQAQARTSNRTVSFFPVNVSTPSRRARQRINALLSLLVIVSMLASPLPLSVKASPYHPSHPSGAATRDMAFMPTSAQVSTSTRAYPPAQMVIGRDKPGEAGKAIAAINTPATDSEYKLAAIPALPHSRNGGPKAAPAAPIQPDAPISFVLDDGTTESSIGFGSTSERAAIWLNRFTPPTGSYPIALQNVQILWPGQPNDNLLIGQTARLLVYQDADGDGNPANATLIGSPITVTVGVTNSFQTYPVSVVAPGPSGDIYLGFEDYWAVSGFTPRLFPAALDETPPSRMRSWVAARNVGAPNINNLGNNNILATGDALGFPGNWLIRANGVSAAPGLDECSVPNPVVACPVRHYGDTVNTAIGNSWRTYTDLSVPGRGVPLLFARTYNSQQAGTNGPLGYGWTHSYNMYVLTDTTTSEYKVFQENGSVAPFPISITSTHYSRVLANLSRNPDGSFVFTRTHGLDAFYFRPVNGANVARLYQIVDRDGYVTSLTYNGQGLVQTVTDPAGRTLTLTYSGGLLSSVHDSATPIRSVRFGYDTANGDLTSARDVGGQTTTYAYQFNGPDSAHLLQSITDPNGGVVANSYDGYTTTSHVLTQTDPMSRTTQFGYTTLPSGNTQTRITDTLNLVTLHEYQSNKLVRSTEFPGASQQAVYSYTYAPTLGVASITDPLSHTWFNTWDTSGNLTSSTDPLGRSLSYKYNPSTNDLLVMTNTVGLTTTYTYDNWGNTASVARPVTETNTVAFTNYDYDPSHHGDLLTVIDPRGNKWKHTYDTYGYQATSSNPLGETATSLHDNIGRQTRATDPKGNSATFAYNPYNEVTVLTNALGYTTTYSYDKVGNVKTVTDANFHPITYIYNLDNELTRTTHPDNTYEEYTYDGLGRVYTQSNELKELTRYTYDDLNRRWHVADPLTRTTEYRYDAAGLLKSTLDGEGRFSYFDYDNANQLQTVKYDDPNTAAVKFSYNSRGMRTQMTDAVGITNYGYDSLDRLTTMQDGDANGRNLLYSYDLSNNVTQIASNFHNEPRRFIRQYDDANRLQAAYDQYGNFTAFTYDPNSNLTRITYPAITSGYTSMGYDNTNQVISSTTSTVGGSPYITLDYTRDHIGLIRTAHDKVVTRDLQGVRFVDTSHDYSYDNRDRLTSEVLTTTTGAPNAIGITSASNSNSTRNTNSPTDNTTVALNIWRYDAASQLTQTLSVPGVGEAVTTTRQYDPADQLTTLVETTGISTTRNITFTYGPTGNRLLATEHVSQQNATYQYDQANRLTYFNSEQGNDTYYRYNGDGLRMAKSNNPQFTRPMTYTWDMVGMGGGLPLLLQDSKANYTYGPGGRVLLEGVWPYPGQPGQPGQGKGPSKPKTGNAPNTLDVEYFYHTDGLGSIRVMDDYQGFGYAAYTYNYDAYGNRTCSSCPQYNPFGYTGQYTDDESGMLYLRARYYDPTTQQFISRDPASGGSGQPYTYAGGNPVNYVDPTGNWPSGPEEQIPSEGGVREQSNGTWVQQSMPGFWSTVSSLGAMNGSIEGGIVPISDRPVGRTKPKYDRENGRGVYIGRDGSGTVRYVGQGDAPRRVRDHKLEPDKADLAWEFTANNNLSKAEARGLEQLLIDEYGGAGGGQLRNKDRGAGPRNNNVIEYLNAGRPLLQEALDIIKNGR